jgi:general secretion pathway protein C
MSTGPASDLQLALDRALERLRPWAPRLPAIAAIVFAVGAGFAGAELMWRIYDLVAPPAQQRVSSAVPVERHDDPGAAAAQLAASQAFGTPDAAADDGAEAPDSRLDLKLRGVIAAAEPKWSRAFIAGGDGEDRAYPLGAQLPGGAVVQAIHPDRVVLSRNGSLETLRLPRDEPSSAAPSPIQTTDLRGAQQNPSRLLDWLRPVVATESNTGRQLGYRVYPGRDPDRFTKLGLAPGDLVTAVNGQPLDDPSRSMELMRNLTASDNITLTVERDGAQRIVQIPVLQ